MSKISNSIFRMIIMTCAYLIFIFTSNSFAQTGNEEKIDAQYVVINFLQFNQKSPKVTIDTDKKRLSNVEEYMKVLKYSPYVTQNYYRIKYRFYNEWIKKISKDLWQQQDFYYEDCVICGNDGLNQVIVSEGVSINNYKMNVRVYYCSLKMSNNNGILEREDIVSIDRSDCKDRIDFKSEGDLLVELLKIDGRWLVNSATKIIKPFIPQTNIPSKKKKYNSANKSNNNSNKKIGLGITPDYLFDGHGVFIGRVSENYPAKNAGLKRGDIVVKLGDTKIEDLKSYMIALKKIKIGQTKKVQVNRAGEILIFDVTF